MMYVIPKLVHPLVNGIRSRWVWSKGRRHLVYMKLDPAKMAWIIGQKRKGARNSVIATAMKVSERRVQELWREHRLSGKVPELRRPGRKEAATSAEERGFIARAYEEQRASACLLERSIHAKYGVRISHNRIHRVLKEMGVALSEPRKQKRRKWVRYEREFSNSMWHGDWTLLEGKGWLVAYIDDASRFVVGYGLFPEATSAHSVEVLERAISKHGRPASILTDRGIQFYAVEADDRLRGLTVFERYLIEHDIRHILSRVNHPQTNGKVERFFGTVKAKMKWFDSVDELVAWYNTVRLHMSLNMEAAETPYQAFLRKMPADGRARDEGTREVQKAEG